MTLTLSEDLQNRLNQIALRSGRAAESLAQEAIERFVGYDEWFVREVEKGLEAGDHGELIDHEEIGKLIDTRYPG